MKNYSRLYSWVWLFLACNFLSRGFSPPAPPRLVGWVSVRARWVWKILAKWKFWWASNICLRQESQFANEFWIIFVFTCMSNHFGADFHVQKWFSLSHPFLNLFSRSVVSHCIFVVLYFIFHCRYFMACSEICAYYDSCTCVNAHVSRVIV